MRFGKSFLTRRKMNWRLRLGNTPFRRHSRKSWGYFISAEDGWRVPILFLFGCGCNSRTGTYSICFLLYLMELVSFYYISEIAVHGEMVFWSCEIWLECSSLFCGIHWRALENYKRNQNRMENDLFCIRFGFFF